MAVSFFLLLTITASQTTSFLLACLLCIHVLLDYSHRTRVANNAEATYACSFFPLFMKPTDEPDTCYAISRIAPESLLLDKVD